MKIVNVVGARPNFMKIAPLIEEMKRYPQIEQILVHTGQHYDSNMSKLFFGELGIPEPDIYLGVGSDSHAKQTAEIMKRFEDVLIKEKPDLLIVVGDVNSTLACSLVASKLHIKVAHVEAGLRSYNWEMAEEINRVVTDRLSDYLFTTSKDACENLENEGIRKDKIFFVGNVMIDTLLKHKKKVDKSKILEKLGLRKGDYAGLTMHRPENVDKKEILELLLSAIEEIQKNIKIIYPLHPRTRKMITKFGFEDWLRNMGNLIVTAPLGYLDFIKLVSNARFMLTDSGGIQEETTILGVPCLTLREETERPVTVSEGTNIIVGVDREKIINESLKLIEGDKIKGDIPALWDGKAAERIVKVLLE